jgi:hypothetical protein
VVAATLDPSETKGSVGDECTICLGDEGPPFPIQGGCACRGPSGLAHLACRVQMATHQFDEIGPLAWSLNGCQF